MRSSTRRLDKTKVIFYSVREGVRGEKLYLEQGWPTSAHWRATEFVKTLQKAALFLFMYRKGGGDV
jgi:hypothetical protein